MSNADIKMAVVVSEFNQEITEPLLQSTLSTLINHGISREKITITHVPGAVEIPLTAKLLAIKKKYDAIICLGAVIRGETDHYKYVCEQVSQGCQNVMMEFNVPVIFGVLTTKNVKLAKKRALGIKNNKGIESAEAAIQMIKVVKSLS
ncbi:MAG: 6,7-dimethyl-8-ribityllumazine synthase [uncultured bacterium]|nr:MAG: 6,7-dimethyl-8-ribityllumazine synthase [uncultured bacterium]